MLTPLPELRLAKLTTTWKVDASESLAGVTPDDTVCFRDVHVVGASLLLYVALAAVPIAVAPSNICTEVVSGSVAASTFHITVAETLVIVAAAGTSALAIPKPLN